MTESWDPRKDLQVAGTVMLFRRKQRLSPPTTESAEVNTRRDTYVVREVLNTPTLLYLNAFTSPLSVLNADLAAVVLAFTKGG